MVCICTVVPGGAYNIIPGHYKLFFMTGIDWFVLCALLLGMVGYGLYKSRTTKNLDGYFLSNRSMPWYLVLLSIMGTQASAITFLSAPGQAFTDGMRFVQYYFGLPIAMVVICITFVPLFNRLKVYTAYEFLEKRFDRKTRTLTSALFLLQRGLSTGISIYAPSIILSSLFGWDIFWTNIVMGGFLIIYTVAGGAKAVAYTQKMQLIIIFIAMALAGYFVIKLLPPGVGFVDALQVGGKLGKMNVITTGHTENGFNWKDRYNIISGVLGGFFLALSYFGTDQSQVGRGPRGRCERPLDDHRVAHVEGDGQALEHVAAFARLAQFEHGAARDHFAAMRQEVEQHLLEVQQLRLAVDQRHHVHAEGVLELGLLVQVVQHHFRHFAAFQFDHHAHARLVGLVADVGDALELLVAHVFGDALEQRLLVDLVRQLVDDDGDAAAVLAVFLEVGLGAHDDAPAAGAVAVAHAGDAVDDAGGGEVRRGNRLQRGSKTIFLWGIAQGDTALRPGAIIDVSVTSWVRSSRSRWTSLRAPDRRRGRPRHRVSRRRPPAPGWRRRPGLRRSAPPRGRRRATPRPAAAATRRRAGAAMPSRRRHHPADTAVVAHAHPRRLRTHERAPPQRGPGAARRDHLRVREDLRVVHQRPRGVLHLA